MGQHSSKASTEATLEVPSADTTSIRTGHQSSSSVISVPRSMFTQCKHKLSRIELYSLHQTFDELKTVQSDQFECIEVKEFLAHLDLPRSIEPAGILLFKSFSYLGSYGNGPPAAIRLTFPAFVTAFVLLTGKMDDNDEHAHMFETMLFESLAIPSVSDQDDTTTSHQQPATTTTTAVEKKDVSTTSTHKGGLSLADLGVDFNDLDFDTLGDTHSEPSIDDNKILARDLVSLFALFLWIAKMEKEQGLTASGSNMQDTLSTTENEQSMAQQIVQSMMTTTTTSSPRDEHDEQQEAGPTVSEHTFFNWQRRNAPHLFQTLQSFIYSKFAIHNQASFNTSSTLSDLVLMQDVVSVPDTSDILTLPYCALLAWSPLPDLARQIKKWPRLYSGYEDGFAMNRFESRVFKYPGPTLVVIQGEIKGVGTKTWACYLQDKWKQSKQHYWGSDACFVAELAPTFEVFSSTHCNTQYIYYHNDFGIAFGGTTKSNQPPKQPVAMPTPSHDDPAAIHVPTGFLLTLDNTLQRGIYSQEAYPALPTLTASASRKRFYEPFETVNIEVFGLGDEKARQIQEREWNFEKREALRRAGLQFRQDHGNKVDRELLRMAGIIDDDNRQER
ncbi:hypothetical protein RO3G_10250 [Lichtheimia corymbifera JMRC:FSU:9682]|uniref:Restriction of telomere capping protein 5 n=1 Tax=Lichtheimia corymbifera JMRC:FSU:9682 TaxID=1263082 RepID=A0A068SFV1_9FUNG|nr:hypothetical protein RO3G_10250 [Lichtheimia corymbifera JMRC:FSU:9682]